MTTVTNFDTASDALAEALPTYERRDNQTRLAHGIEEHLSRIAPNRNAIYQAGCGVGKSFGYLIPAILSGKRVIVATATKALQDQIANKDLPFLAEHLGVPFTYSVLKGRSNYLCQASLSKLAEDDPTAYSTIQSMLEDLPVDDPSFFAEIDDFNVDPKVWRSVTTTSGECPGKRQCPFGETCFSEKAKAAAKAANIVVVNHALLLTDLMVHQVSRGWASLLGEYDSLIIDEAHELEEYATTVFGQSLREGSLVNLGADIQSFTGKYGEALNVRDYQGAVRGLWEQLEHGRLLQADVARVGDEIVNLYERLTDLSDAIDCFVVKNVKDTEDGKKAEAQRQKYLSRIGNLSAAISQLVTGQEDFHDLVRWVETEKFGRGQEEFKVLHTVPVSVADILRNLLFKSGRDCPNCEGSGDDGEAKCPQCAGSGTRPDVVSVLVSATLTVGGSFKYVAGRMGVDEYDSFDVGTPFDYKTQSLLYVPDHIVEPTPKNRERWETESLIEIRELIQASDGRALLLFTSNKDLNNAYEALAPRLPYTCFRQGQDTNKNLAAKFMEDETSVLFATRSFFTGVDFQGDACKLVVISKLPFPVPTDAVYEARCEDVDRKGGNSFKDYTIPLMSLILQQGFGRLIRHSDDRGVVAILDKRITTKSYGKQILRSLPDVPLATRFEDVTDFYGED